MEHRRLRERATDTVVLDAVLLLEELEHLGGVLVEHSVLNEGALEVAVADQVVLNVDDLEDYATNDECRTRMVSSNSRSKSQCEVLASVSSRCSEVIALYVRALQRDVSASANQVFASSDH